MIVAHRPNWSDKVPPLAFRFNSYSFDSLSIPLIICPEEYGISSVVEPWHWVYLTKVGTTKRGLVYCFSTKEEAKQYVDRRCNPQPIEPKFYVNLCTCGGQWDYRVINGVIYNHCNDCNKPLYEEHKEKINMFAIADVDLFDLL